jgi:multiple sugar transport system permease protein
MRPGDATAPIAGPTVAAGPSARGRRSRTRDDRVAFLFLSPWLLGLLLVIGGPVILMFIASLTDWSLTSDPRFVGLDNYARMLSDHRFSQSVGVTLRYVVLSVPLFMVTGLGLALLLNAKLRGIGVFRTILFVPSILAGVAVAVLWLQILSPETGILNQVLRALGVDHPPRWLSSPDWAVPAVVLTGIWTIGGGAIIYLAGLQNIPPHLYEAAALDGAGAPSRFRHITLPMLSPTLFFVFVTTLIGAFQVFDVAFVLGGSRGGGGALLFYLLNLWNEGFRNGRYGYASALAVVFVAAASIVVIVAMRMSERLVYYENDDRGAAG